MTDRPKKVTSALVLRTWRPTPHVVRLVLGGEELAGLPVGEFTDHYIKIVFPVAGIDHPRPIDLAAIRRDLPREQWPRLRAYTVRAWDAAAGEWTGAAALRPGDEVLFVGPGGAYAPSPAADWHLLVGDESALPAIAAACPGCPSVRPRTCSSRSTARPTSSRCPAPARCG